MSFFSVLVLFMDARLANQMLLARDLSPNAPSDLVLITVVPSPYALPSWLQTLSNLTSIHLESLFILTPTYNDTEFHRSYNLTRRSKRDVDYNVGGASVEIDVGVYDAFLLLLQAAKRVLDKGLSVGNSMHLLSNIVNMSISSPFSDVMVDHTGDTFSSYVVLAYSTSVRHFHEAFSMSLTAEKNALEFSVIQGVDWSVGIPASDPCFFKDWSCYVPETGKS